MEAHTLHRRLGALLAGIGIAICIVVATSLILPRQDVHDDSKDYGYVYSGAKSSSVDFIHANLTDETLLVLGSSEFSTPARLVPQIPAKTFGTHNYGARFMLVGEAFDQSLWDTIALGALAKEGLPKDKVALIVGLGMFTDGGLDASTFSTRFSYTLYREFCSNPRIPRDVVAKVQDRISEQGIDETTVRSAAPQNPLDIIDGMVIGGIDDLRLRSQLNETRAAGIPLAAGPIQTPDWAELHAQALRDAQRLSTNNDWGIEDDFYASQLEPALESLKDARADETYTDTPEYDDLELFLTVCDSCGIKPLVVIEPVLGKYYDHIGISLETRSAAYQHIRSIVQSHPTAQLADYSDHEYDKHFLFDIVHFGWTGWIDAEKSLYEFATEGK